jgi:SAM-dependent methyltransferase
MMNPAEFANIAEAERTFWWYRGMRRILFGLLDPLAKKRRIHTVLEAGCGTGFNAAALEQRYGWRAFPVDLQKEGLEYGKAMGISRPTQADLAALPFSAGAFDAAVCLDVIIHFPPGDESRALAELSRVLAPGGLLVLRASAFDILRSHHSQFTFEKQRFTARRLASAVLDHGIRVLRCTYANSLLLPVALLKFRIWEPLTGRIPQSGVRPVGRWLNRLLGAPLGMESWWLSAGLNIPLGQSVILIGEKQS